MTYSTPNQGLPKAYPHLSPLGNLFNIFFKSCSNPIRALFEPCSSDSRTYSTLFTAYPKNNRCLSLNQCLFEPYSNPFKPSQNHTRKLLKPNNNLSQAWPLIHPFQPSLKTNSNPIRTLFSTYSAPTQGLSKTYQNLSPLGNPIEPILQSLLKSYSIPIRALIKSYKPDEPDEPDERARGRLRSATSEPDEPSVRS